MFKSLLFKHEKVCINPSAFFEKWKCSPLQNTAVGCDSSWAWLPLAWPSQRQWAETVLEVPAVDPSMRMDKDDDLNCCPWHRAARQEKFHTQSSAGEEGDGMNPINFKQVFSAHSTGAEARVRIIDWTDHLAGKYWWSTCTCKIAHMVKHLLVHTGLTLVSQSYPFSGYKIRCLVFYFSKGLPGQRANPGRRTWDEIVVMLCGEVKLAEARSQWMFISD